MTFHHCPSEILRQVDCEYAQKKMLFCVWNSEHSSAHSKGPSFSRKPSEGGTASRTVQAGAQSRSSLFTPLSLRAKVAQQVEEIRLSSKRCDLWAASLGGSWAHTPWITLSLRVAATIHSRRERFFPKLARDWLLLWNSIHAYPNQQTQRFSSVSAFREGKQQV